ncbi:MAG: flippase activity-associated protein Agl23 [Verrucomicrobiales bacterium]
MALRLNTPHSRASASLIPTAAGLFFLALVLTLVTRFTFLERRVMHTDEAVQAELFLAPMLSGGSYHYHSADGHGPLLVYSTRALCWLTGVDSPAELSEFLLRLTPALYSLALVLVVWLMADGLGRGAAVWAMLFTALSPMLVYYSRYYIMEVPLVFLTTLAIASGWRYAVSRHPGWMLLAGVAVGLMHVTKETFLIQLIAGGLAVLATWGIEFFLSGTGYGQINRRSTRDHSPLGLHLALAVLAAGAVSFLLFSGFLSKPGQFFDSLKSYIEYAKRAEGSGHEKPWWWYLALIWGKRDADGFPVGEWPLVVLAVVGACKAFIAKPSRYENVRLQRFLALYAMALLCGYSLIAYKTPWSILGAEHALVLLAGIGAATLLNVPWGRFYALVAWILLAATTLYLGVQVWRQNYKWPADPERNPYVYSHTSPDVLRLVRQVNDAANARGGDPKDFKVFIIHPESGHPLPWYFRRLGGGATSELPEDNSLLSQSDVIITIPEATSLIGALVSSSHRELQETWMLRTDAPLRALFRRSLLPDLPQPAPAPAAPLENPAPAPEVPTPPTDTATPPPPPAQINPTSDPQPIDPQRSEPSTADR